MFPVTGALLDAYLVIHRSLSPLFLVITAASGVLYGMLSAFLVYGRRDKRGLSQVSQTMGQLVRPPGALMSSAARFLCTKKTYELVVKPAIQDMRYEYFEALAERSKARALWLRIVGTMTVFAALGLHKVTKIVWNVWHSIK